MNNKSEDKPRVRPPSVQAAYLLEKVRKMEKEEAGVVETAARKAQEMVTDAEVRGRASVEAARVKHRARIAGLVAKAPAEVQKHYFALAGAGKGEE